MPRYEPWFDPHAPEIIGVRGGGCNAINERAGAGGRMRMHTRLTDNRKLQFRTDGRVGYDRMAVAEFRKISGIDGKIKKSSDGFGTMN